MPSSRHARCTRSAISPRFAIRIFLNIAEDEKPLRLLDAEELLSVFDALAVLREDFGHGPGPFRLDLVHQLHRFDDAQGLPGADHGPHLDEGRRVRGGGPIEAAHEGARYVRRIAVAVALRRDRGATLEGGGGGREVSGNACDTARPAGDAHPDAAL